jgi:2-keto-4-pentenoate hydratase/2-oxohepta-3-ene-1,7-dioic acid hydratase in catechol pathway
MKIVQVLHNSNKYFGLLKGTKIEVISDFPWKKFKKTEIIINTDEVKFLAPVQPNKIICLALNYVDKDNSIEHEPLIFFKPASSIIGNNEFIESSFNLNEVWGESELAFVIKKKAKNISESEASKYILGYTIANDVTAKNIDKRDHHLARSKGADTFCVIGPYIDTNFNPGSNFIKGYQNNILIREARLNNRYWTDSKILSWLSSWITLESGDLILTGAPPRITNKVLLNHKDIYKCEVENLGTIENIYIDKNI